MLGEVEVQSVGKSVHQLLKPRRAGGVFLLQRFGIDEELHAEILIDLRFALGLGETAHGVDVVRLHAIEIVLGLGVLHAEDRVGVRLTVDVCDSPVVADDGDVFGLLFPAREIRVLVALEGERDRYRRE